MEFSLIKRFGTCSKDCYGSCCFIGEWNDSSPNLKLVRTKASSLHPFTGGFLCPKLNRRENLLYHPERLKNSLIRMRSKGENQFQNIANKKAISIIANKIKETIEKFGRKSILVAFSSGNCGLISRYAPLRFFGKLGATFTSEGICNEGGCAGLSKIFGTYSTTNPLQLNNSATSLIWIWGSDLSNRNNHAYHLVKKAQKNGTKVVVVDSRRTKIALEADHFIFSNPGLDHLLAILIIKKLIEKEIVCDDFITKNVQGYSELLQEINSISLESVRKNIFPIEPKIDTLVDLLRENLGHTIFNIGYGVQKDFFGGRIVQAIALIQILLGNIGNPGTGIIYSQSDFNRNLLNPIIKYLTGIPSLASIPHVKIMELGPELESERFKMVFIYNFNPASSLPNQNLVRRVLSKNDLYIVVQDLFLNQTTKFADIVIPSRFDLESSDLISPYYFPGFSINYGGPCPYQNCLSNFDFYKKLAEKLGWKNNPLFKETDETLLEGCLELLPLNIRKDLITDGYHTLFNDKDIPFSDLKFPINDGKIQLEGVKLNFGFKKLERILNRKLNQFQLITPSHGYFIHSQLSQIHPEYADDFNRIFLNVQDINSLGLKDKKVLVTNEFGEEIFKVEESREIEKGIALIFSGSPFYNKTNLNANLFTPDIPEELGFSGAYNSAIVEIRKLD